MKFPQTMSKKKADGISNGIFLLGIGILAFSNLWWPGILLALWATLATRQFFTGRFYDLLLSTVFLWGFFIITILNLDWSVIVPVLLVLGGLHLIFREYCVAEGVEDEDVIQEKEKELEDDEQQRKS